MTAVAFAVRATVNTTTQATPMQLVFGRDAILNIQHRADWKYIQDRKQKLIKINNQRENSKRRPYTYSVGEQVLVKTDQRTKYGTSSYLGPYTIVQVNDNGTVRIQQGSTTDTFNIRMITPYRT